MINTFKKLQSQDKEHYSVPKSVHDYIPVTAIYDDGIFRCGNKFTKTWKFADINYLVASRSDKEEMFLLYSELLNTLDTGATTKITINNRRMNRIDFENNILLKDRLDALQEYRKEYNGMLLEKAVGGNSIMQEKYITVSVAKEDIKEARSYFARIGAELENRFAAIGSKCVEMSATERLRILHDFYRSGEETAFSFDLSEMMRKGHDFKDYIAPDSFERFDDYIRIGDKFARVLFEAMKYPEYYYCYEVLYWCGLREGELLALTPADIDFEAKVIHIEKTYAVIDGHEFITTPKTESSKRVVSMPDFLCEELKEYLAMLYDPQPTKRIFRVNKGSLCKKFHECADAVGLKHIPIHGLRHSHVSLLISRKFDIFEISKRIGHKSVKTTQDTYGHLFTETQRSMADDLNSMRR